MESWEIVKTDKYGYIIVPKKEFKEKLGCPFCGIPLLLHDFHVSFETVKKFWHVDVHYKCPKCGNWVTFGVAVSEEDAKKLQSSPLHSKTITDEVLSYIDMMDVGLSEKDVELIKERLKLLGYWGG